MIVRLMILLCGGLAAQAASEVKPPATNAPAIPPAPMSMESLDNRRALGPGDRITYRVVEDQDEPRSLTITDSGDLDVPYFGLVPAAEKTSRQLAADIKQLLEEQLYYQATVIIAIEEVDKSRVTGMVYVTGQVRDKGGFEIPSGETLTVSRAILKAGGFSDFSDKKNVRLIRKGPNGTKTFEINVLKIWEDGDLEKDLVVQPDDLIVVPARLINF